MESYRLKNIIILILVLLNACLLVSLGGRKSAEHTVRREATEQIVALFEAEGIALDPDLIPTQTPPASRSLTRSIEQDAEMAAYFLGSDPLQTNQGGGSYWYSCGSRSAVFRDNGSFTVSAAYHTPENLEAFCEEFCRRFGYFNLSYSLLDGSGTVTATQFFEGVPVYRASVVFLFDKGALATVNGTHLPSAAAEAVPGGTPLSAIAALNAFLTDRREAGGVPSPVTDMYLCYDLQSTTTAPMTLVPSWCITTDIASYLVNSVTGAVTRK